MACMTTPTLALMPQETTPPALMPQVVTPATPQETMLVMRLLETVLELRLILMLRPTREPTREPTLALMPQVIRPETTTRLQPMRAPPPLDELPLATSKETDSMM